MDKAWHDLLNSTIHPLRALLHAGLTTVSVDENVRLEPEVMTRLGRENIGVRIPGDDGYIGTINVYHEIHCLVICLTKLRLHQS